MALYMYSAISKWASSCNNFPLTLLQIKIFIIQAFKKICGYRFFVLTNTNHQMLVKYWQNLKTISFVCIFIHYLINMLAKQQNTENLSTAVSQIHRSNLAQIQKLHLICLYLWNRRNLTSNFILPLVSPQHNVI